MIKHPFVKQRSEAPPVTVAVTMAWRRWAGRAGRVSEMRVLSVTAVLFIIPVGRFGSLTQRQVMRYWTAPACWMSDSFDVLNVTSSPRTGAYSGCPLFHLKEPFGTQTFVYWLPKAKRWSTPSSPSICNLKILVQKLWPQKCSAAESSLLMAFDHFRRPNLWQNDEFGQRAELMAAIRGDFASQSWLSQLGAIYLVSPC